MKTKEFKNIISQNVSKANELVINIIEHSCVPFNSWFETHSRLPENPLKFNEFQGIFLI